MKGKSGESYNVGTNKNLKNLDLVKKILNICKSMNIKIGEKTKIKFVKDRPGHDLRYALDCKKITSTLKWRPSKNFETGLKETFDWYYNNYVFFENFSKKKFFKRLGLKL